jgi:hypothetical protein
MGTRLRVLITFQLYGIAIDLDVAPQPRFRHCTCAPRPRRRFQLTTARTGCLCTTY